MKPAVFLFSLVLLSVPAPAVLAQTAASSAVITVNRVSDGCEIILPPDIAKTVQDQIWLVVDGKSEGMGGGFYSTNIAFKPLHYTASVSDALDGQIKDILKAQGFPIKANVTTYSITYGVNAPISGSVSKPLHFRHESSVLAFTPLPETATYHLDDKITLFDAVAIDSSIETSGILGQSVEKQSQLPHDLLHRITIQVQFVPKTP